MITSFVYEQKNGHVHVHVLSKKSVGEKGILNGDLVFSPEEWDALVDSLFLMTAPTDCENYVELLERKD